MRSGFLVSRYTLVRKGRASGEEGAKKDEEQLKLFLLSFDLSFFCCFPCSPTRLLSLSRGRLFFLLSGPCMRRHPAEITLCPVFPAPFHFRPCICDYSQLGSISSTTSDAAAEQTPLETCDVAIGHVAQTPSLTIGRISPAIRSQPFATLA